ncbi:MAG: flagellar biosynthetic protein FliO [Nitrosospira sp.]
MNTGNIHAFPAAILNKAAMAADSFHRACATRQPRNHAAGWWYFSAILLLGLLGCSAFSAHAASAAPAANSPVSDGSMFQVMLGLGLVLAVIAGSAWLLRRFGGVTRGPASAIKVIGGSAVGQRERVVLVEVADTWLVIGVAPGHVTALHSMPKGESASAIADETTDRAGEARFSAWFRQVMEKRNEK